MNEGSLGLIVEGLVSILLVATIFYCISVNRKLERLRDEQTGMVQFIKELSIATTNADNAIQSLRNTVQDSGDQLAGQIDKGRNMNRLLQSQIENADQTMNKLVIMIGRVEAQPGSTSFQQTNDPTSHVVSDLRRSMIGFDDLDLDPDMVSNNLQQTDGLISDRKGAL